ncbi:hypothetical protein BCR34DRAFT_327939 [Clohesyomyces aquaticus]|uniref:DUF6536 domain-containing protein n=1 Tax=Clohesyomyces aquaticus TaxID=1231657 RepID=A0A1Y1ZM74_9PLEO|nr:hypothetical protein BCR34DRAFT_327939 [Clohesyomyces aquaticus]
MKLRLQKEKWKRSLDLFATASCVVLIINITFLIWAASRNEIHEGRALLYDASCREVRRANTGIHLLINVLSSVLLAASNYCMQCLAAPSRTEVHEAHQNGRYLDVGIPSLHNIVSPYLGTGKKLMWLLLGVSSFPLHLCYNSAVFYSASAQTYGVFQIKPSVMDALQQGVYDYGPVDPLSRKVDPHKQIFPLYTAAYQKGNLERLETSECIGAYSQVFQSTHGNVYLVPADDSANVPDLKWDIPSIERTTGCGAQVGNEWIVGQYVGDCRNQGYNNYLSRLQANTSDWGPFGAKIDHCFSEPTREHCKLQFSSHLMAIVIAFNAVKTLAILWTISRLRQVPLLTLGDAVSSFLQDSDATTKDMCLVSQADITKMGTSWKMQTLLRPYTGQRSRWFAAVKRGALVTCIAALALAICALAALLAWGYTAIPGTKDFKSVFSTGFGTLDSRTIIQSGTSGRGTTGIFQNVFVANSPQVIISLIYFSYNAVITSMLVAHEWSGYDTHRKGLRVSSAKNTVQRSTYFLQLPYRYALPLLALSTIVHWLASQSIFVISVEVYNMYGQHTVPCYQFPELEFSWTGLSRRGYCGEDFMSCAYSPLAILLTIVVTLLLVGFLVGLGRKGLGEVPVVGSSSVAIAAACHRRAEEEEAWLKGVQWGAFREAVRDEGGIIIGHCGISSLDVEKPTVGVLYG